MHQTLSYAYHNLPIPGGGYVTGFLFSKENPGVFYLRTDIGGTYRFLPQEKHWKSLSSHVTMHDLSETYPTAIALDEKNPDRLFIACGVNGQEEGVLAISNDQGAHFTYASIPTLVHGNLNGRGSGFRLLLDTSQKDCLYFASQQGGLLRTPDLGKTWEKLNVNGEETMTFVWLSANGNCILAGTAGLHHKVGNMRGHGLYVSYDRGATFVPFPLPENLEIPDSKLSGLVPQRWDCDGKYLYITLSATGKNSYVVEHGYSCDSGDALGGRVIRLTLNEKGYPSLEEGFTEITPLLPEQTPTPFLPYGFGGITSCKEKPGLLACSTLCKDDHDMIFLSLDYGNSWKVILHDLSIGKMQFRAPYMAPSCNGGHNLIHWLSDVKCNPFDPQELWFNSGTGVFVTHNLLEEEVVFSDWCDGLEETVHLNIYSLPKGNVKVVDILGDLGGFAFRDLQTPCHNSFADDKDNRYITCLNADYSDYHPETVVVTARGNWTGKTKGGLILTKDGCHSFTRLPMPYGISEKIDALLSGMERPNVNAGWVALSSDCKHLVWSLADVISLPADCVVCSHDGGNSFTQVTIVPLEGKTPGLFKAYADRVNPALFYGFGEDSRLYVSTDSGQTFREKALPVSFPLANFGLVDCANKTEIRGESGKEGVFFLAMADHGLWKLNYDVTADAFTLTALTPAGDAVYRVGLGLLSPEGDYFTQDKALYVCATLEGEYGFFQSLNQGKSWKRLNTEDQMFGDINSIDGDSREFGRFYLATGSLGAIYGEPL